MIRRGLTPPMHGASVGVATLLVWPFYARFAAEPLEQLDEKRALFRRLTRAQREDWMVRSFGEEGGAQIMREYPEDFLDEGEQLRRVRRVKERAGELRAAIAQMPQVDVLLDVMRTMNAEMTPQEEHVPEDLLAMSMWCGKDYRSRYTLMKTLDECGLLETYLSDWPCPERA